MKNINWRKVHIIIFSVCMALIVLCAVMTAVLMVSSGALESQRAALRWSGDSERQYTQISVFLQDGVEYTSYRVLELREALKKSFAKIPSDYAGTAGEHAWTDAYSTEFSTRVATDRKSTDVTATAAGGDFFFFHQMKFFAGGPFFDSDLNSDRIVLDTDAAWQLFGSSDVAGLTVTIGGQPFVVAGVVERTPGEDADDIYGGNPRVYLPFAAYEQYIAPDDARISCYEVVLPNPIADFAYDAVKDNLGLGESEYVLVDNTARYTHSALWETFRALAKRSIRTDGMTYPYWENAAAVQVDRLSVVMVVQMASLIVIAMTAIVYFLAGIVKLSSKFKKKKYKYL